MMIQQSNCFIVVERGVGMQNMMQERALASAGQSRAGSNIGGGQMVAADFVLTPSVVFSENNAGGVGGAVGGLLGGKAAAVAGGLKFKEAQTSMLVADSRRGVQVAAAEGSTKKADMRLGGALFGGGGGASAGGYGNTNEGKIIAAAFMDNYNKVVGVVRGDPEPAAQRRDAEAGSRGRRRQGRRVFNEGDVLGPKIAERQADGRAVRHREGGGDARTRRRARCRSAARRTATSTSRARTPAAGSRLCSSTSAEDRTGGVQQKRSA